MPAIVDVNLDVDTMRLTMDSGAKTQDVKYSKIDRLRFGQTAVKKLFRTSTVKLVEVHIRGVPEPYTITSDKLKSFEQTAAYLQKVAEKNRVKIEKQGE